MNHSNDTATKDNGNMDDIGRLIRHVGAREAVPPHRLERSREHVRGHWEQAVREQRTGALSNRLVRLARVAGVVAVAGVALVLASRWPTTTVIEVASVERIVGEFQVDGRQVAVGGTVAAGASITTGLNDRVALRLANGQALRVDTGSILVLHAPNRLALEAGALYIDTSGVADGDPVQVDTPLGMARDIGTQFQVRLASDSMIVGVRDGQVEVGQPGGAVRSVNAGYQMAFSSGGPEEGEELDTEDLSWRWIETVTPVFDIDGASLADYLAWYASEDGLELVWANDESRARARRTTLTGGIEGVTPRESLSVVQRVAPFEYRREQGRFWVRVD